MDCHSPGQGLMPASFMVRAAPIDGNASGEEEVLDPDFGESAIGRVAPVDSGTYIYHISESFSYQFVFLTSKRLEWYWYS